MIQFISLVLLITCSSGCQSTTLDQTTSSSLSNYDRLGVDAFSFASGSLPNYCTVSGAANSDTEMTGIHCFVNINDGEFGNSNSWIPSQSNGFAGFRLDDLNTLYTVEGFCISRDVGGHTDRANDILTIDVTLDVDADADSNWCPVGSLSRDGVASELCFQLSSPVDARAIRVVTDSSATCIDELQIFGHISRSANYNKPHFAEGCHLLSAEECCNYKDGRIGTPFYDQRCVRVGNVINPLGDIYVPCQPLNYANGLVSNEFQGDIIDKCFDEWRYAVSDEACTESLIITDPTECQTAFDILDVEYGFHNTWSITEYGCSVDYNNLHWDEPPLLSDEPWNSGEFIAICKMSPPSGFVNAFEGLNDCSGNAVGQFQWQGKMNGCQRLSLDPAMGFSPTWLHQFCDENGIYRVVTYSDPDCSGAQFREPCHIPKSGESDCHVRTNWKDGLYLDPEDAMWRFGIGGGFLFAPGEYPCDTAPQGHCVVGFPELICLPETACSTDNDCSAYGEMRGTSFAVCMTSNDYPEPCSDDECFWQQPCSRPPFSWGFEVAAGTQGSDTDQYNRNQHICPENYARIVTGYDCSAAATWVAQGNYGPYSSVSASYTGTASYYWVHYSCFWDTYSSIAFNTNTARTTSNYPLLCKYLRRRKI